MDNMPMEQWLQAPGSGGIPVGPDDDSEDNDVEQDDDESTELEKKSFIPREDDDDDEQVPETHVRVHKDIIPHPEDFGY